MENSISCVTKSQAASFMKGICMRKTNLVLILTFIFILFLSIFYVKINSQDSLAENTLSNSFKYTGAKVVSSEVYFWGRLEKQYNSIDDVKPITDDLLKSLEVLENSSFSKESLDNDQLHKTEIKGVTKDNRFLEIKVQFDKNNVNLEDPYVSVKVTEDLSSSKLEETKKTVMDVLNRYKIKGRTNSCIIGSYEGKLDYAGMDEISKQIFKGIDADRVEGIKDGNLISVSAYSPNIEEYIKVNGKKVNLNLAIRYNSYENKTYLWLATPVITTEY